MRHREPLMTAISNAASLTRCHVRPVLCMAWIIQTHFPPHIAAAGPSNAADAAAAAATTTAAAASAAGVGLGDISPAELAAAGVTTFVPSGYVPSPVEPGWEIWLGFIAGVVPFAIGSYEFGKRIVSGGVVQGRQRRQGRLMR
mgnify:CR=1 FL=1